MIKLLFFLMSFVFLVGCSDKKSSNNGVAFEPNPVVLEELNITTLATDAEMPSFELPDMNGQLVSSDDFKGSEVLVIAFISNHCPTSQAYEDRLINFTKDYSDKGVKVVAINPNSSLALLPEECGYSDLDDTFETMLIRHEHKGYNFPYLYDGDNHAASLKFGPVSTPHIFVFDAERVLRYNGRLDGVERPGSANAEDLRLAVDQILAGNEIANPVTSAFGCSVKWSWMADWADNINKNWDTRPVEITQIDELGVRELMKNDSDKLRLINVWASWCAPCIIEMPDLVMLQRYYGSRAFELITISADYLDKESEALNVLKKNGASMQNFIFSDDDKQNLTSAIDSEWRGSIPYSVLIEPGGNILYKREGVIDNLTIKRMIVDHQLLGRYY